ncbi:MAG: fibronectin type III domain-containing protein [Spirochaetaceae bacterium]|jgi:hypothetical protein|nr:fibronectin type III domain-containing protein [Spirochaetaceae bacterium]
MKNLTWGILLFISGLVYGIGEKTIVIGGEAGWQAMKNRSRIGEMATMSAYPVLTLSSSGEDSDSLDMFLSFDEAVSDYFTDRVGHYTVTATPGSAASQALFVRAGTGAALFSGLPTILQAGAGKTYPTGNLVVEPRTNALLAAGTVVHDFSLEFWLYPANMENGEQILSWNAITASYALQQIQCTVSRNRIQWDFSNFFAASSLISFNSITTVVPKTWSHHLIRFDSRSGLLEYLINGQLENVLFVTATGHNYGEVYLPVVGNNGKLILGAQFMGMMDEFRLHSSFVTDIALQRYPKSGGIAETIPLDLGDPDSSVLNIEVSGGNQKEIYRGTGRFHFSDDSAIEFFIRASNNPYRMPEWQSFVPGVKLSRIQGRYVQIAAVLYPSGDGEATPYLDTVRIVYRPNEAPAPPTQIRVVAGDGSVDLSWRQSSSKDTAGYRVYYGTASGEYFGEDAALGASPLDVGNCTSVHIDGLKNGTLYYFAVVAYDSAEPFHAGDFSREVTVRPLKTL